MRPPGYFPGGLCTREKGQQVSFAIVSLVLLVVIAIIAIPILIRVFAEAAGRNPNRPANEGRDESDHRDSEPDR
jgi:hypothetical protein